MHVKQTYDVTKNKLWSIDTYVIPLNHNLLINSSSVSCQEIIKAVVRSRLRGERQHGIILDDYSVELIDSTKLNSWNNISEYFFWWFCNVQGLRHELQTKESMGDIFANWIVAMSQLIFVGDWAKDKSLLRSIKINFYTGPKEVLLTTIYNNVLFPLRDIQQTQYSVNGIYDYGFIKADSKSNWTKIHQNIIIFMELAHTCPEVMMWLLNTNIKLNKDFVKSIHPLFASGTLQILHVKYNRDIFLHFISKILSNVGQQGWSIVKHEIKDCSPVFVDLLQFHEQVELEVYR